MDKMNQAMMDPDPGKAGMKSMAAHHQGAIDMSTLILHHTKNPHVLAEAQRLPPRIGSRSPSCDPRCADRPLWPAPERRLRRGKRAG